MPASDQGRHSGLVTPAKKDSDVQIDREYGPRIAFQHLSRYSRNSSLRTHTFPNSAHLSVIANMAIAESGADQALIRQTQTALTRDWPFKFHGQGAQYDANATISNWANITQIEQVEFFSFRS